MLEQLPFRYVNSAYVAAGQFSLPSWSTATLEKKCLYMKCSHIWPVMWAIYRHPSTGHYTNFVILGKDTIYVVGPPLPTSTPCVCDKINLCDRSIWCLSYAATTNALHPEQLTIVCLFYWNIAPSLVTLLLYVSFLIWPHMSPGVQTIAFFSQSSSP